nr:NADH dehydrogenase subunit 6 [Nais communis]
MMTSIVISMMLSAFMLMPMMKTPLTMTLMIIFISLMLALMFSISMSSWFAFLIFLIYVSGMLVMFAYFAATTPNQSKIHIKSTIYILAATSLISFITISTSVPTPLINMQKYQMTNMFSPQNMYMLIIITLILLFTMIIIVKLTTRSKGPLRSFMPSI